MTVGFEITLEAPLEAGTDPRPKAPAGHDKYKYAFDEARRRPGEWIPFKPDVRNVDMLAFHIRQGNRSGAEKGEFAVYSRRGRIWLRKPIDGEYEPCPAERKERASYRWGKYQEVFDAAREAEGEWVWFEPDIGSIHNLAGNIRSGIPRGCDPKEFETKVDGKKLFLRQR